MFKKITISKKIIVLILVLVLAVGGFFLWWQWRETPPEQWDTAKVSPREDYIVRETSEGRVVENKKIGVNFLIPKEWILEDTSSFVSYISFYSPDAEFNERRSDVLEKGCSIDVYISYIKTNLNTLEKVINEDFKKWGSTMKIDEFKKTEVSNFPALKCVTSIENLKMFYITVHLPVGNKVYKMSLASSSREKEKCFQEFDKFLETVSIE